MSKSKHKKLKKNRRSNKQRMISACEYKQHFKYNELIDFINHHLKKDSAFLLVIGNPKEDGLFDCVTYREMSPSSPALLSMVMAKAVSDIAKDIGKPPHELLMELCQTNEVTNLKQFDKQG